MRFSTSLLNRLNPAGLVSLVLALYALPITSAVVDWAAPSALAQTSGNALETVETDNSSLTLLRFETQHYLVRVFRQEGLTYLNVYNKETGYTDLNSVLAYVVQSEGEADPWRVYANQQGDLEYRAMVNPEGDTALEIRLPDGPPAQPEYGFEATYSFPHNFLGADLDTTLTRLTELCWEVDSTSAAGLELVRNQLALALKFDPETQVITYTQLIDLT
ncbi:MAG: hypothetical protein ACFBSG_03035 [Leptolyngbyaceae cyanobacterium]